MDHEVQLLVLMVVAGFLAGLQVGISLARTLALMQRLEREKADR